MMRIPPTLPLTASTAFLPLPTGPAHNTWTPTSISNSNAAPTISSSPTTPIFSVISDFGPSTITTISAAPVSIPPGSGYDLVGWGSKGWGAGVWSELPALTGGDKGLGRGPGKATLAKDGFVTAVATAPAAPSATAAGGGGAEDGVADEKGEKPVASIDISSGGWRRERGI